MIEKIALWLGYVVIIALALAFTGGLLWFAYISYDFFLKKLLGWKNIELRKDLIYFINHKKEIRDYITQKRKH